MPRTSKRSSPGQFVHRPVIGPLTMGVWVEDGTYNGMIKEFNLWAEAESLVELYDELSEMVVSYLVSYGVTLDQSDQDISLTRRPDSELWANAESFSHVYVEATFVFETEPNIRTVYRNKPPKRLDRKRIKELLSEGKVQEAHLVPALVDEP